MSETPKQRTPEGSNILKHARLLKVSQKFIKTEENHLVVKMSK